MKRFAMRDLLAWKERKGRKPLILWGARQVGKTWLMKEFGRACYRQTAYISFFQNRRISAVFDGDFNMERILTSLSIESGVRITPGDTLIILDEIQSCPAALESLKYFAEDASEYHVIAAGSLLGVAMHAGTSFPVGKVDEMNLYPMSYREFLCAIGEEALLEVLEQKKYISDFRDRLIADLRTYYYVGGMPEVVQEFVQSRDFTQVRSRQMALIRQYEEDFSKHIPAAQLAKTRLVWNAIPVQLAKENRKFFFGQVKPGARQKDLEDAIQWLTDYGLVYKVNKVSKPDVPLKSYAEMNAYKLFIFDCGIAAAMSELDASALLEGNRVFTEFKGALTEEYVLTQLISDTDYRPYYYSGEKSTYEMDFLIQKGADVVPIEVKSEVNVKSKSLRAYYDKFQPVMSYRISMADYEAQDWMTNIPLYAIHDLL